ncbi:hypothetical protein [Paracoccus binzhouensis]|uniref:hypothetical protein n=1 Tax=Paracoccus binzhouensis TaxID=2796149 RepID=UPI0018EECB4A|nr:hypothetical protein [Paracoccus binzhouensis]
MLVNGKVLNFSATNVACEAGELGFAHLQVSGIETRGVDFSGSVADWCELGFSICESYLIEAQNIFIENDLGGFLSMAEAQFDADLSDEVLAHANALLRGVAFRRLAGELQVVETVEGQADLDWQAVANLWRAMETTQGDMRMPRLDAGFEKQLRAAMWLS